MNKRFHGSGLRPKPVEQGQVYTLTVQEMSKKNDGVAKVNGFVIFVPNGQIGQTYQVKITKIGNTYAVGEIVSNEEASKTQ